MTHFFTLDEFEQLCFNLATGIDWHQPIPHFKTRFPGRLEACLATPQQTFDKEPLYPTLTKQAAILFYLLIKDHPFMNGNKRIALVALTNFLFRNEKWLEATNAELYELTKDIAQSEAKKKEGILIRIEEFLEERITEIPNKRIQTLVETGLGLAASPHVRAGGDLVEKRKAEYKGFTIEASPFRLKNGQWSLNIYIILYKPESVTARNFSALNTFPTEEEAVAYCFQFGQDIIDGNVGGCSVEGL